MAETWTKRRMPAERAPVTRLQGALEVDGALALDVAVGTATRREDDRVAAGEGVGERVRVLRLDVEQPDLGPEALELLAVVLVAHQGHGDVPVRDQHPVQLQGHLAVASDDSDATHAATLRGPVVAGPSTG